MENQVQVHGALAPKSIRRRLFALPIVIFLLLFVVSIDAIACIVLWLAAGSIQYLEDNVTHFEFIDSTFDLACIAVVRGLILAASLIFLEQWILRKLTKRLSGSHTGERPFVVTLQLGVVVLVSLVCCVYGFVKLGFVVKYWPEASVRMHVAYKVLGVVAIVLPLVEVILSVAAWLLLSRVERALHIFAVINGEGTEVEAAKNSKRRFGRADIKRLIALAQPVS